MARTQVPAPRLRRARALVDPPREPPIWLRREIPAVLLIGLAALSGLAVVAPAGWAGNSWHYVLHALFGWGMYLEPFLLAAFGVALVRQRLDPSYRLSRGEAAGWPVLFVASVALLQVAGEAVAPTAEAAGGALGRLSRAALVGAVGPVGASAVVFVLALVGLALVLGLTPSLLSYHLRRLAASLARAPGALRRQLAELTEAPAPAVLRLGQKPQPIVRTARIDKALAGPEDSARGDWELPPLTLLRPEVGGVLSQAEIGRKVEIIERALADFDVVVRVVEVNPGPTVTQFGLEPGFREKRDKRGMIVRREKVKVAEITSLSNDLALALAAPSIRIEAPVPGREFVGVEVPNSTSALVSLHEIVTSATFQKLRAKTRLALALGEDVSGQPVVADLARMPHLLIAGQTGSGKSICINSIIASLLLQATPDELRLLLVDPKRVELTGYNNVPHLLRSVVVETEKVVSVLKWAVHEMEERYKLFEKLAVRNIEGYNRLAERRPDLRHLFYIVLIIDELANLMMLAPDEVERLICRLAQLARATGIHLIIATQRPSVDVITGLIKANFPTRISFAVASQVDSRTILDSGGAEKLLGRGDMLYLPQEAPKAVRLQGTWVSDEEISAIVDWWRGLGPPSYVEQLVQAESYVAGVDDEPDELYDRAVELAGQFSRLSASLLQRKLRVGYARAARLMDRLEEEGVVASSDTGRSREVIHRDGDESADTESRAGPTKGESRPPVG